MPRKMNGRSSTPTSFRGRPLDPDPSDVRARLTGNKPLASHSSCTMLSGIPFWGDSSELSINENLIGKK